VGVSQADNGARLRTFTLHVDLKKAKVALTITRKRVVFGKNRQTSGFELIAENVD
jgi:hypothetical protein